MNSTCRSCNAPIRWARTETGKRIPVDAAPSPNGNLILRGEAVRFAREGDPSERHLSHFATCPQAKNWRKPRR